MKTPHSEPIVPIRNITVRLALASIILVAPVGCSRTGIGLYDEPGVNDEGGGTQFDGGLDAPGDATNPDTSGGPDVDPDIDPTMDVNPDIDPTSDVNPVNICGDGTLRGYEQCDDGNTQDGDGCDRECQIEPGPRASCLDEIDTQIVESGFAYEVINECVGFCRGDNGVSPGCVSDCMAGTTGMSLDCGTCFGSAADCVHDNCRELCQVDEELCESCQTEQCGPFYEQCAGLPFEFPEDNLCGDAIVRDGEECDDGNRQNGDGCDQRCRHESP